MSNPGLVQQRLLLLVFVLSGFAGLIYQSVWSHYLGLFLGHAAYSQALVLAIFMGGMALGAAWVARAGDRWRNLIRLYAIIELVIGVLGLLFHVVFVGMLGLSYDVLIPALGVPWLVNSYKWVLAALLILPQTVLLGMTFPLMSGGLIRRYPGADGSLLGGLYFTNSIGAAVGALAAGFLLLPTLGMPGAMVVAGVVNLLVGVAAWMLSVNAGVPAPAAETAMVSPGAATAAGAGGGVASPRSEGRIGTPLMKLVLLSTALSGAASFVYEIVWIRMLSLAVGTTLHAFELMLASFIAGLAFGGLWIRKRADRSRAPMRLVGWMQVWMGLTALLSLVLYANAFGWVGWMMESLSRSDGGYTLFNIGTAAIAMLIMMPSAFFAGTTLPLFTVILLRDGQGERSIGRVYAWNTLGSIFGVFLAIHLLIPGVGLKLALCLAAAVDMGIGLYLLRRGDASAPSRRPFVLGSSVAAVALFAAVAFVPFDPMRLASGVYRTGMSELPEGEQVVFYRDGKTASISVVASPNGNVRIATNGKIDASIQIFEDRPPQMDEPTMVMAAALPLAAHPNPRTAAVIGFGSGLSTHALLGDPRIEVVDTIEIEQAMVAGATAYGERVERAYLDPRSRIVIDDAKSFFSGQQKRYDIIVSEPSNPWISGVGALFSEEFYDFIPRHLAEGGLLLQWIQLYEINDTLVTSVLNAMTPAFDDYVAYLSNSGDLLILASPRGPVPETAFERLMGLDIGDDLRRAGVPNTQTMRFRRVADARVLEGLGRMFGGRPNSDYHPILTLRAPKTRFQQLSADALIRLPVMEVPLLEWLGLRVPLPADEPPPRHRHFPAEMLTTRARLQAEIMRGRDVDLPDFLPGSAVSEASRLRALARGCEGGCSNAEARTLVDSMLQVVADQLVYMDADALQGVWIEPDWVDVDVLPEPLQDAFELIAAHAQRDAPAMQQLGERWLSGGNDRPWGLDRFSEYAFAGIQFAYLDAGRLSEMPALEERWGGKVSATGDFQLMRTLLLAMADED